MAEMLQQARAGSFDLLLAGYSDRWQRNLRRTLEVLEDHLHPAGVALVMCDRKILSSDRDHRDQLVDESAAAEKYSRRLSERIIDGYAAKFEQRRDPGGHAPLGFRRQPEPPHTLEVDPATIQTAVALFERYALGTVSSAQLAAETGLNASRIRCILMNPLCNGCIRRRRDGVVAAPWRTDPPVSDWLWARVDEVRRGKTRGGGPKHSGRVDLLAGLLECVCGRRIRSDGTFADGRHRKLHVNPCSDWGTKARLGDETWETPILAQVAEMSLDASTFSDVVAALSSNERPVSLDKARLERQIKALASENAEGKLEDDDYLERKRAIRSEIDTLERSARPGIPAARAVEWLRALADTWVAADVPEAKADLLHAIYARIVVAGERIISARLTPAAQAHGMALALPQVVMARPTGFERADAIHIRVPVEGGEDWCESNLSSAGICPSSPR